MDKSIIIVLGNFMDESSKLNHESCSRLDLAVKLFTNNKFSLILTTGWDYNGIYIEAIADSMKTYILKNSNISHEQVITEKHARDTVGDAIFTKINFVKRKELKNLLVVTSDYHVKRTKKIFSFVYGEHYKIEVIGSKTNKTNKLMLQEDKSLSVFYKTFKGIKPGDDYLIFKRLRLEHPYYNGLIYPQIEDLLNVKKESNIDR